MPNPAETPKRYRAVIFDFDGVLCDSLAMAMQAFNEIRDDEFPQIPRVSSREDMAIVYAGSLRTCLDQWISPEGTSKFFDRHSAAMQAQAQQLSVFPGIGALLNSLPIGSASIVTSAYSDAVRAILGKDQAFEGKSLHTIAGRELRQSKTTKINSILADQGIACDDAVYVGDLESDILYCREVPIDIIAVGYGYHPREHLLNCNPTYFAGSVDELRRLLHRLLSIRN